MTRVGQCPVCHSSYELDDDDIGHMLECDCGTVLFACHSSAAAPIELVCQSCGTEYEADPRDAGQQLQCECGQSILVPDVILRPPLSGDSADMLGESDDEYSDESIDAVVTCPECGEAYEVSLDDVGHETDCQCGCGFLVVMDEHGALSATNVATHEFSDRPLVTTDESESRDSGRRSSEGRSAEKTASWSSRIGIASIALLLLVSILMFVFRDFLAGGDEEIADRPELPQGSESEIVDLSATRRTPAWEPIDSATSRGEDVADPQSIKSLVASSVTSAPAGGRQERPTADPVGEVYRLPPPPIYALPKPRKPRDPIAIPVAEPSGKPPTYRQVFEAYQEAVEMKKTAEKTASAADIESYHEKLGSTIAQLHQYHDWAIVQSDAESDIATINSVRYLLTYLYFTAGHLAETAVMGEAVARWGDKEDPSTHEAAMIALAAMQEASETHWGLPERVGELAQMERLANLIAARWPVDPQLDLIWMNLGFLYEAFNFPERAAAAYQKVNEGSQQYPPAQIAAGNALWAAARREAKEQGKPIDEASRTKARELLSRGLEAQESAEGANSKESVLARLSLAQIEMSGKNLSAAESWLSGTETPVVDSIFVRGGGRAKGIEVSESTTRSIFDLLFAARNQLGDQAGAREAAAQMALVLGSSPEELESKMLSLFTTALRRLQSQSTISADDVAGLVELSQPFVNEGTSLTPANLMWMAEAWSEMGESAASESLTQQCAAEAASFYQLAIGHDEFPPSSLQSARLRCVQLLREAGDPRAALEMTEQVLSSTPNVFALQVEAAETIQQLGMESSDLSQLVAAVEGKGGGSPVWGWGKLVTTLHAARWSEDGNDTHAQLLIRSQYNLAKCRVLIAEMSADRNEARSMLLDVQRMLRTLLSTMESNDHPWRERLEQLRTEVDQLL